MSTKVTLITREPQGIGDGFVVRCSLSMPLGGTEREWLFRAPFAIYARVPLEVLNDAAKSR